MKNPKKVLADLNMSEIEEARPRWKIERRRKKRSPVDQISEKVQDCSVKKKKKKIKKRTPKQDGTS